MNKQDLLVRLEIKDRTFVDKYLDTAGLSNKDEYSDKEATLLLEIRDRVRDGQESHSQIKRDIQSRKKQQREGQNGSGGDPWSAVSPPPRPKPVAPTGDNGMIKPIFDALVEKQEKVDFEVAYQMYIATTPHRLASFLKEKEDSNEHQALMAQTLRSFYTSATDAEIRKIYQECAYIESSDDDGNGYSRSPTLNYLGGEVSIDDNGSSNSSNNNSSSDTTADDSS